jgi:hypothetical protein
VYSLDGTDNPEMLVSEYSHEIVTGVRYGNTIITPDGHPYLAGLIPLERDNGEFQIGAYTITQDGKLLLGGLYDVSGRKEITVRGVTRATNSMIFQLLVLGVTPEETMKMTVVSSGGHHPDSLSAISDYFVKRMEGAG